ncbi:hypothetical protein [Methylococcus geothermalis]|uniref:Uncharacterized protein n=1 Tax=Methylococcus geothermalis TaxID=2681310 RepID=A0A858QBU6_9GAMM|nr:hypothetical protein [Methylococcus geothermalis]QJD31174.1 hypothetical protein GNH96_15310 [Methylococcus geothermalis]
MKYPLALTLACLPLPAEVGGNGWRDVDWLAVANGSIRRHTKEYADSDPGRCPSSNGAVRRVLKGNRLKETT